MRQRLVAGAEIDALTPDEARQLLAAQFEQSVEERARASEYGKTDAGGALAIDVFEVPLGYELDVVRVSIEVGSPPAPVNLSGSEFRRSGRRIQYVGAYNDSLGGWVAFGPRIDTWSRGQGPYLRNGEVFQLVLPGGVTPANTDILVTLEGVLRRPPPGRR